jgi:hypothetical protein
MVFFKTYDKRNLEVKVLLREKEPGAELERQTDDTKKYQTGFK